MKSFFLFFPFIFCCIAGIAQPVFSDVASTCGILPTPGCQAVAVADFNNDGWDDFYLVFATGKTQLYKNLGDGSFLELAKSAGVEVSNFSTTAVWGDINNDGFPDLYVGRQDAPDLLFLNKGDETFQDITFPAGIIQVGKPFSVNMADINNDGYLDIYVSNFLYENILFRNNRNNTFTNATFQARAFDSGKSMGTLFLDFDLDGDQDLYLVHDGNQPNFLYQNDGAGLFTEVAPVAGANTKSQGMGVDAGDINNDGYPDIYITNLDTNILLLNNADGTYSDISSSAGIQDKGMGWGVTFLDFDNNGLQDIYIANDYAFSPYPNVLYRNLGNLTFEKAEATGPVSNKNDSYAVACLDYNQDGNTDILVANKSSDDQVQLFRHSRPPGHWIGLKLIGVQSNRDAIGAQIRLTDNLGVLHYQELRAGQGWQSQNSSVVHFGLGNADSIQELIIRWPSGLVQQVEPPALHQFYRITEGGLPQVGLQPNVPTLTTNPPKRARSVVHLVPNPVEAGNPVQLHFDQMEAGPITLSIFDALGRSLYQKQAVLPAGKTVFSLETSDFLSPAFSGILYLYIKGATESSKRLLVFEPDR